jgi:phosphate starvation-inducible PhoH-like protein
MSISEKTMKIPHDIILQVFGEFDSNIKKIEKTLNVSVINRNNEVKLIGPVANIKKTENVINQLVESANKGIDITPQSVDYTLSLTFENKEKEMSKINEDYICITPNGKYIRPKTLGQKQYIDLIKNKMIVFGVGPAGTGKTYLAMANAITAFKNNEVNRIILTRPAIEAGEKLGFLPGDLQSKVDPYLRPLYDALYEIMGAETFLKNMEKGLIEVAPLAYMRGRTLDNAFIVLDEAQNTTPAQMKMFLTRIGFGSKAIITGDMTQKDLPGDKLSGLEVGMRVLKNINDIGISKLTTKDVVRHPLVQRIVDAYEKYENKQKKK